MEEGGIGECEEEVIISVVDDGRCCCSSAIAGSVPVLLQRNGDVTVAVIVPPGECLAMMLAGEPTVLMPLWRAKESVSYVSGSSSWAVRPEVTGIIIPRRVWESVS